MIGEEKPSLEATLRKLLLEKVEEIAEEIARSKYREVMSSEEAADFLGLSYPHFRRIASSLPRHKLTGRRYAYIRSELLEWLAEQ